MTISEEVRQRYEAEVERQKSEITIPDKVRQRIEAEIERQKYREIPAGDISKWYKALSREDCKQVTALLGDHPNLLKVGWGIGWNEASQFEWNEKPWKERTALHVGVRRGCVELVEQVLLFFKGERFISTYFEMKEEEERNPLSANSTSQPDLVESGEARTVDNNTASPTQDDTMLEGNPQPQPDLVATDEGQTIDTDIRSPSQDDITVKGNRQPRQTSRSAKAGYYVRLQTSLSTSDGQQAEKTGLGLRKALSKMRSRPKPEVDDKKQVTEGDDGNVQEIASGSDSPKLPPAASPAAAEHDIDPDVLRLLLMSKDGEYGLDAIAIAAVHYNRGIWLPLSYAMRECNLYDAHSSLLLPALEITREGEKNRVHRAKLREITESVVKTFESVQRFESTIDAVVRNMYDEHLEFNFLPWQEYLFHFLFTGAAMENLEEYGDHFDITKALWMAVRPSSSDSPPDSSHSLWRFLLELRDGQGRTPLHVAVDSPVATWRFTQVVNIVEEEKKEEVVQCVLNVCDAAGRTALHRAIVSRYSEDEFKAVADFALIHNKLEHVLHRSWEHSIWNSEQDDIQFNMTVLSSNNGFQTRHPSRSDDSSGQYVPIQYNPIHRVILDGNAHRLESVMYWVKSQMKLSLQEESKIGEYFGLDRLCRWRSTAEEQKVVELDASELAALMGDVTVVSTLPRDWYNVKSKKLSRTREKQPWPALHIAANMGNYDMLKLFLDDPLCDPYVEDFEGNTALHHALTMINIGEFQPHLFDYVNCEHIQSNDPRKKQKKKKIMDDDCIIDRQGCINLLLQAGCDIFKTNKKGQPPYPQGELSKNPHFVSWWYGKQAKDFETTQSTLSSAANAISVTAALVATASYVGPLQPPMGFAGDPSQIQDANLWVRIFIFCDTMSFYLAIAAIIFSLIPSLPLPQQQMKDEVRRTRQMVTMGVVILFPSVIFVLLAFVASSIAVVSANVVSSTGGLLTITTASLGGLLCLVTFLLFFVRVLAFSFPKSKWIRKIYNITDLL